MSTAVPLLITLMLGIRELAAWAGVDNEVTLSSRRLFRKSIKRPKCVRKSAPMRGCVTSAITKRHVNSRRNPRLRLRDSHPYVGMVVPLAAQRSQLTRDLRCGMNVRGYTQRSEPVSMRNRRLLALSVIKRRLEAVGQTCAAVDVCRISFPAVCRCRVASNFARGLRSAGDTSRGWSRCCA
jgi:hypothetical protein